MIIVHGISFGDEFSAELYEREIREAQARQTVRFAVAPRHFVDLPSGQRLKAGDEVTLRSLAGGGEAPQVTLNRLLRRGQVLEADHVAEGDGPTAA